MKLVYRCVKECASAVRRGLAPVYAARLPHTKSTYCPARFARVLGKSKSGCAAPRLHPLRRLRVATPRRAKVALLEQRSELCALDIAYQRHERLQPAAKP